MATNLNTPGSTLKHTVTTPKHGDVIDLAIMYVVINIQPASVISESFPMAMEAMFQTRDLLRKATDDQSIVEALQDIKEDSFEYAESYDFIIEHICIDLLTEDRLPEKFNYVMNTLFRVRDALREISNS